MSLTSATAVFTEKDSIIAKIAAKTLESVIRNMKGGKLNDAQSRLAKSSLETLQEVVGAAMKRVTAAEAATAAAAPSLHDFAMKCIAGDLYDYRNVIVLAAHVLSERFAYGTGWFIFNAELKRFAPMSAGLSELHDALREDVATVFNDEYDYIFSRARDGVPGAAEMAARAVQFQNKLSLDRAYRVALIQAWEAAMKNRR